MNQLFAPATHVDDFPGDLFAHLSRPSLPVIVEDEGRRRTGESAVDYRIRRQYRDVAATPPLFPVARLARG
jgi:hypothetical protein